MQQHNTIQAKTVHSGDVCNIIYIYMHTCIYRVARTMCTWRRKPELLFEIRVKSSPSPLTQHTTSSAISRVRLGRVGPYALIYALLGRVNGVLKSSTLLSVFFFFWFSDNFSVFVDDWCVSDLHLSRSVFGFSTVCRSVLVRVSLAVATRSKIVKKRRKDENLNKSLLRYNRSPDSYALKKLEMVCIYAPKQFNTYT